MSDQPDAGDNYPRMPQARPEDLTSPAVPPPPTVTRAVQVMFASAALGIVAVIVGFATKDSMREQILENDPDIEDIDTVVNVALAFSAVVGILFTALWILLAVMVRKGKNWARITTWVVAGLGLIFSLVALLDPPTALGAILTAITALLDIAVIVLLALRPSNEFFARVSGKR